MWFWSLHHIANTPRLKFWKWIHSLGLQEYPFWEYLLGYFSWGEMKKKTDSLQSRTQMAPCLLMRSVALRSKMLQLGIRIAFPLPFHGRSPSHFVRWGSALAFIPRGRFSAKKGHLIEPDRNSATHWGIWNHTSRRASFHGIHVVIDIFQGWGRLCRLRNRESKRNRHTEDGAESGEKNAESLTTFIAPQILQKPHCILAFLSESECNVTIKSPPGLKWTWIFYLFQRKSSNSCAN